MIKYSQIRKIIKEKYIDMYFKIFKLKYIKGTKILLTSTDGLGDNIVRQRLLQKFLIVYGNENIIIMCEEKTKSFLEKLGFKNILIYNSYFRKRIKGKIELIKKISTFGILKIVSLEFNQHDIFVKYLKEIDKVAYKNVFHREMNKFYNLKIEFDKEGYILEQIQNFYQEYFKETIDIERLSPDIRNMYKSNSNYKDIIIFGIGSADRKKMLSPKKVAEILYYIKDKYKKKIVLLGKGNLEKEFITKLNKEIKLSENNIDDLTNKLSLTETLEIINGSFYYLGVDSGLYNFAFGFKKNIIAFFEKRNSFCHDKFKNIQIVFGENNRTTDEYFGTRLLNSIEIKKIILKGEKD